MSEKVSQYMIAVSDSAEGLENMVNLHIRNEWQPIGGVSIHRHATANVFWFTQAMVKK